MSNPKCPRCQSNVYSAEEILGAGQKWHKSCFKCKICDTKLDSTNFSDRNGEIYCKICYGREFGPKGYGYGQGAGTLSMEGSRQDQQENYAAATKSECLTSTDSQRQQSKQTQSSTPRDLSQYKGKDVCPACDKKVYHAEKVVGAGCSYHRSCFKCYSCSKPLDSTTVTDRDGAIYCKGCYAKNFGPKGYGYGVGSGALHLTK
ncbi:cysteine and glycine-rich protein 1-like [Zophobas morio]|uniref:cysteine and glycine-rich protein 1-like n=1 Tax=Zophobas morio TaxID=2755281 RepID=UPI003082E66C